MPTDSRDKGRIFDEIKSRGKEERKAAELWGFAAENIKEGLFHFLAGGIVASAVGEKDV